jgi:hypothetical protein
MVPERPDGADQVPEEVKVTVVMAFPLGGEGGSALPAA